LNGASLITQTQISQLFTRARAVFAFSEWHWVTQFILLKSWKHCESQKILERDNYMTDLRSIYFRLLNLLDQALRQTGILSPGAHPWTPIPS
jgi:hypothetical protein